MGAKKIAVISAGVLFFILSCGVEKSDKVTGPPDSTPPAQIVDLAAGSFNDSTLILTWTAPGDDDTISAATQYDIRHYHLPLTTINWDSAASVPNIPTPQPAGTPETLLVVNLEPETQYYFGIMSVDDHANWSALSNIAAGELHDTIPPPPITDLQVSPSGYTFIELTWTVPGDSGMASDLVAYDIRYATSEITAQNFAAAEQWADPPAPLSPGSVQTYTFSNLNINTTYYFAIKTGDEVPNWSAMSNVAVGATAADTTPPTPIGDLRVVDTSATTATLVWTASGDDGNLGVASFYDVRYATTLITEASFIDAQIAANPPLPSAAGIEDTCIVTGLAGGVVYYFAVRIADEAYNWSTVSNVVTDTIIIRADMIPPAPIMDLRVIDERYTSIELAWTAPGDDINAGTATAYDIRYSTDAITAQNFLDADQVSNPPVPLPPDSTQTFTIFDLDTNTTYYFAIKTADEEANWSMISSIALGATRADTLAPATINDLHVVDSTETTVTLAWTAPGDDLNAGQASFYDVRYSTTAITEVNFVDAHIAAGAPIPSVAGTNETFAITNLESGRMYYFAVKTADEALNWSQLSNRVWAMTAGPDITPPAPITDLAVIDSSLTSLTLAWTAPGDDGDAGTASAYDIRFGARTIMPGECPYECWQEGCEQFYWCMPSPDNEQEPSPASARDTFVLTGLSSLTGYYVAMCAGDESQNWSGMSNQVFGTTMTSDDTIPPAPISAFGPTDIRASSTVLSWREVGDDGMLGSAAAYDMRYSSSFEITDETWETAIQVDGEPTPQRALRAVSFSFDNLQANTEYYFGLKAVDDKGQWSPLAVTSVQTIGNTDTWQIANLGGIGNAVIPSPDGGFVFVGNLYGNGLRGHCRKMDITGTATFWQATVDGYVDNSELRSIVQAPSGGYLITGGHFSWYGYYNHKIDGSLDLLHLGEDGSELMHRSYSLVDGDDGSSIGNSVGCTPDGGYIVAGNRSWDDSDFLLKTNAFGDRIWRNPLTGMNESHKVVVAGTGYLTVGMSGNDVNLIKSDSVGNIQWGTLYGGSGIDKGIDIMPLSGGNYLIIGLTESFGSGMKDIYLLWVDSLGDKFNEMFIGGGDDDVAHGITPTSDGNFVIAGSTRSFGAGGSDVYLIKINTAGTVLWEKAIGGPEDDGANDVAEAMDGGLLIVGWTSSYGYAGTSIYIIKTDANGEL
ncbi:fibronectin type III domain-containing protein [Candidatus Zixiibacteriota bacterium]